MKMLLLILLFVSCKVMNPRPRFYDSTYIQRDTISVKVFSDSAAGRFDTVKYRKQVINISHSQGLFKTGNGIYYFAVSTLLLLFAILKYK